MDKQIPFNVSDIELLTVRDIQGIMRMSYAGVLKMLKRLPPEAVIRTRGKGKRYLVHSWALARDLQLDRCPGCGRPWPNAGK